MRTIILQENFLEIPIVDKDGKTVLVVKFDKTDDGVKRLKEKQEEVIELAKENTPDDDLEATKEFLKSAVDGTFQEGTFDALYQLNPSLMIVATYFLQLCYAVKEDIEGKHGMDLVEKYMKG